MLLDSGRGWGVGEVRNADLIRAVLDGEHLQFRYGGQWVDCGGDAQTWLTLLVMASTRNNRYRVRPSSATPMDGFGEGNRGS